MCCLVAIAAMIGPRVAILVWWLFDQVRWKAAFSSFLWVLVGFIFFPWTTLMWALVAPTGVWGFDWLWLGLAFVVDLGSYSGGALSRRRRAY